MILRNTGAEIIHPKGSIVVCRTCGVPLYRLVANIWDGESCGDTRWKYAPVEMQDLQVLMERPDLEPGVRAAIKFWTPAQQYAHCTVIPALENGKEFPECPSCHREMVLGEIPQDRDGKARFIDRAYTKVCLKTIPPFGVGRRAS
jgi:hypothetical protein